VTLAVRGAKSRIVQELLPLLPAGEQVVSVARHGQVPIDADRYLFCAGLLLGLAHPSPEQENAIYQANFHSVRRACERIIAVNDRARICVIGSESGFSGSFDTAYAQAKKRLHQWVEAKRLRTPEQQLVCIAPSIIADAGMTMRRDDGDVLIARCRSHPKRRFLASAEVARLIHFVLYVDEGYLSGVTLRMNGGMHTTCTA
jgi:NAD(P)-dependent dehydrogenase (short-subunit alcohol dehydrogenase family)